MGKAKRKVTKEKGESNKGAAEARRRERLTKVLRRIRERLLDGAVKEGKKSRRDREEEEMS